jgi:hypothetical protein
LQKLILLCIGLVLCFIIIPHGSATDDEDIDIINEFLSSGKETSGGSQPPADTPGKSDTKIPGQDATDRDAGSVSILPLQSSSSDKGNVPYRLATTTAPSDKSSAEETLKESRPCECVKYFLCNIDNETVVDNGDVLGLIDIRLGATRPSPCPHYFDICCQVYKKKFPMCDSMHNVSLDDSK